MRAASRSLGVVDVRLATGHARAEVVAERAEDHDRSAGHVLARVVARALDHGGGAAVADAEPLPHPAGDEELPAGRAVEDGVAGQDRVAGVVGRRAHDDAAAALALADVVLGLADELERDAVGEERTEALPGRCR